MSAAAAVLPGEKSLVAAAKVSKAHDFKPIALDYYGMTVHVGVTPEKTRHIVKSEDEFTSAIEKLYKADASDTIIVTQNTVYIVSGELKQKAMKTIPDDDGSDD